MNITKEQIKDWEAKKKVSKLANGLKQKQFHDLCKESLINIEKEALPQLINELIITIRFNIDESENKLSKIEKKMEGIVEVLQEYRDESINKLQNIYKDQDSTQNKLLNINERFLTKGIVALLLTYLGDKTFVDVFISDLKRRGAEGVITDIVLQKRGVYISFLQSTLIMALAEIGDSKAIKPILALSKDISANVNHLGPTINNALTKLGFLYPEMILEEYKQSKSDQLLGTLLAIDKKNKSSMVPDLLTKDEQTRVIAKLEDGKNSINFSILVKALYTVDQQKAIDLIFKELNRFGSLVEPEELFNILANSNNIKIITPMLALCRKISFPHNKLVAPTLKRLSSLEATSMIFNYINDKNPQVKEIAINSINKNLAQIEGATEKIIEMIQTEKSLDQINIINISGYTKDIRIVEPILKVYSQKSIFDFTECVSRALLDLAKNEEVDELIQNGLSNKSDLFLGWVFAAGVIKSKRSVTTLINLYESGDKREKKEIVKALGKIKTPESKEFYKLHKPKCYIATAVYGSYDSHNVQILRQFRDESLLKSTLGKHFVKFYYAISPSLSKYFSKNKILNKLGKIILDNLIKHIS